MGCWSESCAISGLEIPAYADVVVAILDHRKDYAHQYGAFSHYELSCPPTYGTYSDYGDIELEAYGTRELDRKFFMDALEKSRRQYDPKEDSHTDYMAHMWWCRRDVWDHCDSLPIENSFGDDPKTIGEAIAARRSKLEIIVEGLKEDRINISKLDKDDHRGLIDITIKSEIRTRDFDRVYDLGKTCVHIVHSITKAIDNNDEELIQNLIEAYCRSMKLRYIGEELRRSIAPSTRVGPQHGGYEAILTLNQFVFDVCKKELADYE